MVKAKIVLVRFFQSAPNTSFLAVAWKGCSKQTIVLRKNPIISTKFCCCKFDIISYFHYKVASVEYTSF